MRIKGSLGKLLPGFGHLALDTARDIAVNVPGDLRPEVIACDEFACTLLSWMSCCRDVMMFANDIFPKLFVPWDIDSLLEHDDSILFSPVCLLRVFQRSFDNVVQVVSRLFDVVDEVVI